MRIVRASRRHLSPLAALMAASPLLRRYRVTSATATASLAEAVRARDIVLVALEGDAAVGLAWIIPTRALDDAAYLRLLLVSATARSRGVGAALLAQGEREARARHCRHVMLLVTRTNHRARSFYERHGYRHVGDLPGFIRRGITESLYLKSRRA